MPIIISILKVRSVLPALAKNAHHYFNPEGSVSVASFSKNAYHCFNPEGFFSVASLSKKMPIIASILKVWSVLPALAKNAYHYFNPEGLVSVASFSKKCLSLFQS